MKEQLTKELPLITLVGPPNSGKTTLFNLLSGKNVKTVNYPGSTVEYSASRLLSKFEINAKVVDSPGIISLHPNSPDEKVAINSLYSYSKPGTAHLLINTVDVSQLSRHLLLSKQLIEAGFHIIIVLTMTDVLSRKGISISEQKLKDELKCDVISINGRTGSGLDKVISSVYCNLIILEKLVNKIQPLTAPDVEKDDVIQSFNEIEQIINRVSIEYCAENLPNMTEANKQLNIIGEKIGVNGNSPDRFTLKIDSFLLHKFWGFAAFILIMGLTFTSIFWLATPLMGLIDNAFGNLGEVVSSGLGTGWFSSLIADGIINGAGAVLVFVPQIIILFLILGILEDTGYLARGAMLIDKPLSKIGLNGRSFVPMVSGFACAIPAMLAARTIPNRRERLLTIFILPLMSCSARLPVYALLIAYLIPGDKPLLGGFILAGIYIFSILSSVIIAGVINKFRENLLKAEDNSSFILELPTYKIPKINSVIKNTYLSSREYLFRAGPIILLFSIIIWFATFFPDIDPQIETQNLSQQEIVNLQSTVRFENSYATQFGKLVQPVMTPLGMDWRVGVSLISAFAAREVFVSSLALIFNVTDDEEGNSILNSMEEATVGDTGQKLFTSATVTGLIIFFVFALQCLSTIAVSRKETGGWRIPILQVVMFTLIAYMATLVTVNGLRVIGVE
ncbi:MAG: ferrous iron transport protein B [Ignavibacteriaceae bacterium]|nr:ferrous iron transport protein B [Ignavibacteriaceae bacterium]